MRFVMHALICTFTCRLSASVRLTAGMRAFAVVRVIAGVRVIVGVRVIASTARAFVPMKFNAPTAMRFNITAIAKRSLCMRALNAGEPGKASLYATYKIDDETDDEDRAESDIHEFLQSWIRVLIGSRPGEPVGTLAHAASDLVSMIDPIISTDQWFGEIRPIENRFCPRPSTSALPHKGLNS